MRSEGDWTKVCSQYCDQVRRVGGIFDPKLKGAAPKEHDNACRKRRRALIKANGGDLKRNFDRLEIFERDNWICHICGELVDRALPGRSPMGATIDHLVPLVDGGQHSRANVALAHNSCNAKRGNARRMKAEAGDHAYGSQEAALQESQL